MRPKGMQFKNNEGNTELMYANLYNTTTSTKIQLIEEIKGKYRGTLIKMLKYKEFI